MLRPSAGIWTNRHRPLASIPSVLRSSSQSTEHTFCLEIELVVAACLALHFLPRSCIRHALAPLHASTAWTCWCIDLSPIKNTQKKKHAPPDSKNPGAYLFDMGSLKPGLSKIGSVGGSFWIIIDYIWNAGFLAGTALCEAWSADFVQTPGKSFKTNKYPGKMLK